MTVELLLQLLAGEDCLLSVDDDHMVAAVHMGSEVNLVLAAQDGGSGSSGPAERTVRASMIYHLRLIS